MLTIEWTLSYRDGSEAGVIQRMASPMTNPDDAFVHAKVSWVTIFAHLEPQEIDGFQILNDDGRVVRRWHRRTPGL